MYQVMVTFDWRDEDGVDMCVYEYDRTEGSDRKFRYEERLRTEGDAGDPGSVLSVLVRLADFLARAKAAIDGVS